MVPMRLFAAVQPPPAVLDHLERALELARGGGDQGRGPLRWTPPEDRHLTLAFYGGTPEGQVEELAAALASVAARTPPFEIALRGAGVFDRRTLWTGVQGDTGVLTGLMAEAGDLGAELLGRTDDRTRSRAHLTVARVRSAARRTPRTRPPSGHGAGQGAGHGAGHGSGRAGATADVAALAHALAVYQGPSWTVGEIVLMSSVLGEGPSGGPRHDVVERFPLAAVAG